MQSKLKKPKNNELFKQSVINIKPLNHRNKDTLLSTFANVTKIKGG